jgi:hypothetical protein
MDRLYGRSHGFSIRLRPAKAAGEPLEKLFEALAFNGLVLLRIGNLAIGRTCVVCGHGNLIVNIVGEFAP